MEMAVRHINEINMYTKVNLDRQQRSKEQYATAFNADLSPKMVIPFQQNPNSFGREEELEKISNYLTPTQDHSLRTYTIYGRRGIGKTEIALQFAHTNPTNFDAIFWVQCETAVSIRQSFTNIAMSLNLPGAAPEGHHEENLLAVQNWLKHTCLYPYRSAKYQLSS